MNVALVNSVPSDAAVQSFWSCLRVNLTVPFLRSATPVLFPLRTFR